MKTPSLSPESINNILANMFEDEESADVFFQVGNNGRQIPAHSAVLSRASEGFRVRLKGNWAGMTKIAEMIGVEEKVFRSLLIFIYRGGEIDFETRHLLDVLKLARSFLMQDMVAKITSNEVFDAYTPLHVWSFLSFAVIAGDEELQNRCLTQIDSDANRFLSLDGFQSVESSVLKLLVGRNTLGISEFDLFNFLVSWSEFNCQRQGLEPSAEQQRSLMQGFLFDIRYSLMSLEDLSQVVETNILTLDEIKIIRTTITMDPTSIPVQSPAQSSGSLGNKTTTPLSLDECQEELKKAMAKIDQKEKKLQEAMAKINQQEEVINSLELEQELARPMPELDRDELTRIINDLAVENEALKAQVTQAQNSVQPRVQRQPSDSWYILPVLTASLYTVVALFLFGNKNFLSIIGINLIIFICTAIAHRMTL